ncbi:MAG: RAD55 family ATPase [Rhodothermales bacterium]
MTTLGATTTHSGIDIVDQYWGGLYQGGSYLIRGGSAENRHALTLRFLQASVATQELALVISPGRPQGLMQQADSLGFNLREAHDKGLLKLLRFPPASALQTLGDEGLDRILSDVVSLIRQYHPHRVVIDDFTPFVQFHSVDRLRQAFGPMLEHLAPLDLTLLLVMSEPAREPAHRVATFISDQMTGVLHIEETGMDETVSEPPIRLISQKGHRPYPPTDQADAQAGASYPPVHTGDGVSAAHLPELVHHTDRDAFGRRLQKHFHQHAVKDTPFLLLAIRSDSEQTLDFSVFYNCARALLNEGCDWLVDLTNKRLIVLLADSRPEDAQRFFSRLKIRLRKAVPQQVDTYLQAISAIVVSNGEPFPNAEEFLSTALDEE